MKQQDVLVAIKQIATGVNGVCTPCYQGLLELYGRDRVDIILNIKKLKNSDPRKFTPELFATEHLKDVDALIKKYDSLYNKKNIQAEYDNLAYCEKKIAYDIGESDENPDAY